MSDTVVIGADSAPDIAAAINAALSDPQVTTVVLTAGEFVLHSSIVVPSGKTLIGAGSAETVLRAASDFQIIGPSDNGVVISERYAVGITLSDFTVDAAKISPEGLRLNGVFMKFATDFTIERVDAGNATGYAHFAQGDVGTYIAGTPLVVASGSYTDCHTVNSQVHFEQMFCDGITLTNCSASDGDGDISTEAYFHPLVGSQNISYIDCAATGGGFLGFSMLASVRPLANILIENCQIELTSPSMGSALIALGGLPVEGLTIVDSSFIAHNYIAIRLGGVTGTASESYFQGGLMAMQVTTSGDGTPSQFVVSDSVALGLNDPAKQLGVAGVHSDQADYLVWNGGTIEARAGVMFPISGQATVSPETHLIRAGYDAVTTYVEDSSPLAAFAGESWQVPATGSLNGAELRVDFQAFGWGEDELSLIGVDGIDTSNSQVSIDGRVIGTVAGGENGSDLVITLNALADLSDAQTLLEAIGYCNTSDEPLHTTARPLLATLVLADGTQGAVSASVATMLMDDPSHLYLNASGMSPLLYIEGDAPIRLAPDAVVTDIDSTDLAGSTLAVRISSGYEAGDALSIINSENAPLGLVRSGLSVFFDGRAFGVVISNTQGVMTIKLGTGATLSAVSALVEAIGFVQTGDDPSANPRSISFDLFTKDGRAIAIDPVGVAVLPTDDPGIARPDFVATDEATPVEFNPLGNDTDPDQFLDSLLFINGISVGLGDTVTLASGARVTVLAGSHLRYDPVDAFRWLADPQSGTTLTQATDSFSYSLSGGSETVATVSLTGVQSGEDILQGDALANRLIATTAGQTLLGLGGADRLDDGVLPASLAGGAGDDLYIIANAASVLTEAAGQGVDEVNTALATFRLPENFERLVYTGAGARFYGYGNAGENLLKGGANADFLTGYAGNDTLLGGGGNDVLDGGAGMDVLDGGPGGDVMYGAGANDTYYVDHIYDVVIEDGDGGADRVYVSVANYTLPANVENMSFSGSGSFSGVGNALSNQILGGGGNDSLVGLDGNDRMYGFGGHDNLDGGAGDDWLFGGDGVDQLTGGAGADHFVYDVALKSESADHITDFETGLDLFELSRLVFSTIEPGVLAAEAFVIGTQATDAASRIIYDPVTGNAWRQLRWPVERQL